MKKKREQPLELRFLSKYCERRTKSMALNFLLLVVGGIIGLVVLTGMIGFIIYSIKKDKEREER